MLGVSKNVFLLLIRFCCNANLCSMLFVKPYLPPKIWLVPCDILFVASERKLHRHVTSNSVQVSGQVLVELLEYLRMLQPQMIEKIALSLSFKIRHSYNREERIQERESFTITHPSSFFFFH